ncbi:M16 family metallopeptidase [Aureibaculum luteum]|uniref:M16 family metallopeptidase n=1 Tax=Aureibaculum luteum TaxID=1548456 RepID=UPI000E4731EC|nr:insulinase family protein [Aureibaculum luteum]
MRKLIFALAMIIASGNMFAQETIDLSSKIPTDPNIRTGKLENGLTYYLRNNGKPEDKVVLRLAINAGSILEDDDQQGLAHFMEHMNFNGTKNFKKNELVDYLQSIGVKFGAHLNAYTSFDETVYMLPIPSDNEEKLEKGFQIIEDWAFNALLTDDEIDKERGVVLEEYRIGLGADKRMLANYLPKMMYNSQYAERLPIGKKNILETFKPEVIKRFRDDWYRPDLMAVIAVGDVDLDKLEAKIKEHFTKAKAKKNPRERKIFDVPNHEETFVAIETDKEATFNRVQLLYKDRKPKEVETNLEDYRNSIIKGLFSQMLNNRLQELTNGENPPFVYGATYYGGTYARSKNAYQSFAMTSPTGQLTALKTLLEENERVKRHGFQKGEFERAKTAIIARMDKAFQNKDKNESDRYVGEYVRNFLEQEPIPGIEWEYDFYKKALPTIQLDEVNGLIANYLHDDNRVVVITGSEKEGIPKVTEKQVTDLLVEVEKSDIQPYQDSDLGEALMTEIPKLGAIIKEVKDENLGTTTLTLVNGATVVYKKTDFKDDEVLFEAFSYGGTNEYDLETYKKTARANGGLNEAGVNGFNKTDLGKMLTGKIAGVRPYIGSESEGMSGNATPKDLETLFQLIYLNFTSLNKDEKAFTSFASKQKAFLGSIMSNPSIYFQIELGKFMNEKNERYMGFPTPEEFDAADYNLAYKKYKERFANAGDFKFYFVGNFDEAKLREFSKQYIASLPSTNVKEDIKDLGFRSLSGSHEKIVKKGTEPKSSVLIQYKGETKYNAKDDHMLQSLGELLTIKLIEKLREEEAGVYGVGARGGLDKMPYGSYSFTISFPCGPDNVEKLKEAALAQVQEIIENGPTEEDVDKVKQAQLLDYKENLKKNKYWISALKNSDYNKSDSSKILGKTKDIDSITAEKIQAVANKYLTDGYILAILYPEDKE